MPAIELGHSERCAMGAHALFSFQIVPLTRAAVENTRVANNWKQEIEVMTSASCESRYCSAPIALRLHMPIVREMRLNEKMKSKDRGATGIQGGKQEKEGGGI
jgi:hypothetical protein